MTKTGIQLGGQSLRVLGTAAVLYAFSIILIDISPFFIGIYVDHLNLTLAQAGFVQTIDQAGGIAGAVVGFFLMPRIAWRNLIIGASILATLANILTALVDSFGLLLIVRFMSGFGVVLITTVTACILARAVVPDRAFGIGLALGMALSAIAIWLLEILRVQFGYAASLASGAIWLGAGIFIAFLLPRTLGGPTVALGELGDKAHRQGSDSVGRAALIALGLFGISVNVLYGYVERIGIDNGLDQSGVANALALGFIFSAFGSLIPSIFGAMGGRLKWILFTTLVFVASLYGLYTANTVALYTVAFGVYASVWNMGLAYYMSLTAENDPKHRYTRAMYIINVAAQSIGPAIAAAILTGAPLSTIFLIAPMPALLAVALLFYFAWRTKKNLIVKPLMPLH